MNALKWLKSVLPLFVICFSLLSRAEAQALLVSPAQLNFGVVYENAPDSLPLTLTNTLNRDVTVYNIRFYNTYGAPAFSTLYNWFVVPANGSVTLWVRFAPRHNIYHNSEMIIENDGLRGVSRVDLVGQGRFSNAYYSTTEDLKEEPLKSSFHTLLGIGYDTLGYTVARDSMFMQIDNQSLNGQGAAINTIESCYTGALATGYVNRTDCQTTFSFNTEHTFPQGFFNSLEPMRSDLHHLYACDDLSNNTRGNNPFGVVSSNVTWSGGGSKSDGNYFEPRDAQKGKAARSLLYFVIRYQDYTNFVQPQEALLRLWHTGFPPDAIDRRRNDDIYSDQHNRNPFVDYPQFIERIHLICGTSTEPSAPSLDFPEDTIVYGYVAPGTSADFEYVIVNKGNEAIDLTNFNLTLPSVFSFASGGNNITLQPGEALPLIITASPSSTSAANAQLTFNTSLSSSPSVTVPIYLNDPLVNTIANHSEPSFDIYPNPVADQLTVHVAQSCAFSVSMCDASGRQLIEPFSANGTCSINLAALAPGCYFLNMNGSGFNIRRIIIKP